MWFTKGEVFRMNNLYVGVVFNIGERADDVPLAAVELHLARLQVSSVLVSQVNATVKIFKRDATEATEEATEATEELTGLGGKVPGSTGNRGRSLLVATGASQPTGTSQSQAAASPPSTTYAFEFEIEGVITVGEFEAIFWASYADGVFEANVTIAAPVTVMGVAFMIEGRGQLTLPCKEFGDIEVSAQVQITAVSEDLQKSLGRAVQVDRSPG